MVIVTNYKPTLPSQVQFHRRHRLLLYGKLRNTTVLAIRHLDTKDEVETKLKNVPIRIRGSDVIKLAIIFVHFLIFVPFSVFILYRTSLLWLELSLW